MYALYWEYMAGSIVAQAMLEELGADHELRHVDMEAGQHKRAEYLARVPSGRVPAMQLPDGTTIGETSAIVTVLGEHFPRSSLVPIAQEPDRASFLFWLNVMATSGYLTVARHGHPERYATSAQAIEQVKYLIQYPVGAGARPVNLVDDQNGVETFLEGFLGHKTCLWHGAINGIHQ